MHGKVAAALVAALVLALAGCGGTETTTVSRAQAVKRLEAACRAGTLEGQKLFRPGSGRATAVRALLTNFQTIDDQIDGVETTGSAKADLDAFKQTVRVRIDLLRRVADADAADQLRLLESQEAAMRAATTRSFAAIERLGARHVCP